MLKKHAFVSSGLVFLLLGVVWAISITTPSVYAQDPTPPPDKDAVSQLYPGGISTVTGWLTTMYGDPPPDSNQPGIPIVVLQSDSGIDLVHLQMNYNQALPYIGQEVQVEGTVMPGVSTQGTSGALPILDVTLVRPVAGSTASLQTAITGSQPWVNLLCKFSDVATTPNTDAFYTNLFSSTYPGLNHYWQQISNGLININGTQTVFQWFILPQPRSFYVSNSSVNLGAIFNDCTAAANASVNFPTFVGVNIMLNDTLGCCAWGGQRFATLDGQSKTYRVTWNPPAYQNHSTLAHEMGHGYGLPHSSGPANNPPNELSVYVSSWDMMSDASGTCAASQAGYGCIAPGTIGYYMEMLEWLPQSRIQTVNAGNQVNVTLERLRLVQNTANKAMIRIPVDANRFYTVEVREQSGYDQNVPGQAVIIHWVDLGWDTSSNRGPALVVDSDTNNTNVNDAGAMWQVGETFYDSVNNIEIAVLSQSGSTYTIRARNKFNAAIADLALGLTSNSIGYNAGENISYTLTVNNLGPAQATGVTVTHSLPTNTGVSFVSAGSGCTHASGTVTCSIGTLNSGASTTRTVTIATSASTTGALNSSATVTTAQLDNNPSNNSASFTHSVVSNDLIQNAIHVTSTPYSNTQNTVEASKTNDEPTPSCASPGRTVWYKFTAPATTQATFSTAGSNFDTVMALYTGTPGNLTQIACSDDVPGGGLTSSIIQNVTNGTVYYVMIGGFNNAGGQLSVSITSLAPTAAPTLATLAPVIPVTPATPLPFLIAPPVLTNIDGGGLDWIKSGGWATQAAANFSGASGLGWQITGSPSGTSTLQWNHQISLAGVPNPRLSFAYQLNSTGAAAQVQVRNPGGAWQNLTTLPVNSDWQTRVLNLDAYSGQTIELRFAWVATGTAGDRWRLDNLYVFNMPSSQIGNPPEEIGDITVPGIIIVPEQPSVELPQFEPTPEISPSPEVTIVPVSPG